MWDPGGGRQLNSRLEAAPTVFKCFFLQPYKRLCPDSLIRNIIMESGINGKAPTFNYIYEIGIVELKFYEIWEWV
jgi:hypothetical protein